MAKQKLEELEVEEEELEETEEVEEEEVSEEEVEEEEDEDSEDEEEEEEEPIPATTTKTKKSKQKEVDEYTPRFTKKDIQAIVQTRVNSKNTTIKKLKEDLSLLDEMCEITGLTRAQMKSRLAGIDDVTKARMMNIPVETLRTSIQTRRESEKIAQERKKLEREKNEAAIMKDPAYADYEYYKEDVDEILEAYPTMSIKDAYILAKGGDGLKEVERMAVERAIVKQAKKKTVVKGNSGIVTKKTEKVDPAVAQIAEKLGMSVAEYAKYSDFDGLDGYESLKSKSKRK